MNKKNLSPFDCDMCAMIEDLTGKEVLIEPTKDNICVSWEFAKCNKRTPEGQTAEAIKQAVKGRLGDRAIMFDYSEGRHFVWFSYDDTDYPEEIRTNICAIDNSIGQRYRAIPNRYDAIEVRNDNLSDLVKFTGGGTLTKSNKNTIFSFDNRYGVIVDAYAGMYILRDMKGNYFLKTKEQFLKYYEKIDKVELELKNGDIVEKFFLNDAMKSLLSQDDLKALLSNLFSDDIESRIIKLKEEYNEFINASNLYLDDINNDDLLYKTIDELSDLNCVVFHIASLFGLTQFQLLEIAKEKIQGRQIDPNFMRDGSMNENIKNLMRNIEFLKCENCEGVFDIDTFIYDTEGVPLCKKCFDELSKCAEFYKEESEDE